MSESKHTPVAWLVATGATHEGRETYTRHEQRPPLCDAEPIYAPDLAAEVERLKSALTKISGIRDSMIGCQKVNWSEHVYPLVAALDAAGFEGASYEVARDQIGTLLERTNKAEAEVERLRAENDRLRAKLGNSPEPCAYCALPADKLLDCHMGFPGCPRADDMMLCGHFGAAMEAAGLRADLDAERRKVEALRSASVDSRGWLVEWRYHGSVQWLYLWAVAGGGFSFTADASKALRLARREDAEAVLEWARDTDSRRGLHSSTFLVTEHVWESAALASTEGGA